MARTDGRTTARGFTLVELLVVIAVIALLIGILVPALAGARASSQRVASAANLRQIAVYNVLYSQDNEEWYPMVYAPGGNVQNSATTKRPTPEMSAQLQGSYGGYAGFYSLNQKDTTAPNTSVYRKRTYFKWTPTGPSAGVWKASAVDQIPPVMGRYMEGPGSYAVLQNPADSSDGGENGAAYPLMTPQKIKDEYSVAWCNISYFYIAGLKRTDPSLCFLGDETNAVDWGNVQSLNIPNWHGSFRRGDPDFTKRGFQDVDNHGSKGGNFAYSDGHVTWLSASKDPNSDSVEPHDHIFDEINAFLRKRGDNTSAVQTID